MIMANKWEIGFYEWRAVGVFGKGVLHGEGGFMMRCGTHTLSSNDLILNYFNTNAILKFL